MLPSLNYMILLSSHIGGVDGSRLKRVLLAAVERGRIDAAHAFGY